ncbi:MAG: MFS transporter [Burkholderiales bacterium]|nr:MFS transporter [Burkholderiales bacterium]MDE2611122.1 MFS transporter [Burkholderiales bacterium]
MRALFGLLLGYAILVAGNSLLTTLVSLQLLHGQWTSLTVGLVQSCYYVGFILGAPLAGRLVTHVGQHRAFVAFGALGTLSALGFARFDAPAAWALLRTISGVSMVFIFTSLESSINTAVRNSERGRAFGTYLVVTYVGVSAGQFLLGTTQAAGALQWLMVAGLLAGSVIPAALLGSWIVPQAERPAAPALASGAVGISDGHVGAGPLPAPLPSARAQARALDGLHELWDAAPRCVPACVIAGLLSSAFYAMTPVYLTRIGYGNAAIAQAMGIALIGALLAQWPVGRWSDFSERRTILCALAIMTALASAVLVVARSHVVVDATLFVYVSLIFSLYGVIVSDVNDRINPGKRVAVSAALLLMFSLGGSAGPAVAAVCMRVLGSGGLYVFTLAVTAGLAWLMRPRQALAAAL